MILAAGRARRMRPLSDETHKALLTVGETTILERIVEGLHSIGVRRITVVTGYRADDVQAYLLDRFPDGGLRFLENADYATTNNVVSLALALEAIDIADGDLVLAECDLLVEPEVFSLLLRPGNVALVDTYRTGMDGTVVSVVDGFVSAVHAPHVQGPGFVYADKRKTLNLYRFERGFVEGALRPMVRWYAESVDAGSYYELVLAKLVDLPRQRIAAVEVPPGSWIEVDDPNDLAAARFVFEPGRRAEILDDALGGHWSFEILDFSFMANRYFPTDGMLAAMGHALPELVSSYGSRQAVVDRKLAWALRCRPERVRALAGASQAFPWLAEILPAGRVAVPAPTFGEYRRAFPRCHRVPRPPGHRPRRPRRARGGQRHDRRGEPEQPDRHHARHGGPARACGPAPGDEVPRRRVVRGVQRPALAHRAPRARPAHERRRPHELEQGARCLRAAPRVRVHGGSGPARPDRCAPSGVGDRRDVRVPARAAAEVPPAARVLDRAHHRGS